MRRKRAGIAEQMRFILDKAEREKRGLTASERKQYKEMEDEVTRLMEDIQREEGLRALESDLAGRLGPDPRELLGGFRSDNGDEIRMLRPDERVADYIERRSPAVDGSVSPGVEASLSSGRFLRGIVTGDWKGADAEKRALMVADDTLGGYLLPHPLSARIIDLARNRSVVVAAGAQTVPMESNTLDLAKILQDPTAYWRGENQTITSSDMSFGKLTLKAMTLGALVKCSVEVIEDATNLQQVVEQSLSQALALELDRACLFGEGTPVEPLGLYNVDGVQVIDMGTNGAAIEDFSKISQAAGKILEANGPEARNLACVMSPREFTTIDAFVDLQNQPLRPPESYAAMRKLVSNQIPVDMAKGSADNASIICVGDFSQLMLGMRTNLTIEVSRNAADAAGSAFSDMQVWIRAYLRADMVVARAPWFCVIDGVIPA